MSIRADVAGPIKQPSGLYHCLGCGAKYGTLFIQLTVSTVRFHWSMLFKFKFRMDVFKCGTFFRESSVFNLSSDVCSTPSLHLTR